MKSCSRKCWTNKEIGEIGEIVEENIDRKWIMCNAMAEGLCICVQSNEITRMTAKMTFFLTVSGCWKVDIP